MSLLLVYGAHSRVHAPFKELRWHEHSQPLYKLLQSYPSHSTENRAVVKYAYEARTVESFFPNLCKRNERIPTCAHNVLTSMTTSEPNEGHRIGLEPNPARRRTSVPSCPTRSARGCVNVEAARASASSAKNTPGDSSDFF
jgi:hypothetical protein